MALAPVSTLLLPLEQDETITTIMPLPEDESTWEQLHVMFATSSGGVRRNLLSDFVEIRQNGKIAMKLDEGDKILGVDICTEAHDVLLTSEKGQAIRFPVTDVRVFAGRNSTGVRGIRLADDDKLISMAILHHIDATAEEKRAYLKRAAQMRRAASGEGSDADVPELEDDEGADVELSVERYAELGAGEQFVLTLSENGFGKRSSAYEYRVSGRGGKGIIAMIVNDRNGDLAGSFPVEDGDEIMLDSVGMDVIVYFGEFSFGSPADLFLFLFF